MTNEVATRATGTAVGALANLRKGLANVQAAIPTTNTEPFLRLLKDGGWVFSAENFEVEDGSRWAVNPLSIKHGFVCWTNYPVQTKKKNEKLGSRMVPMTEAKPDPNSLPQYSDGQGGNWPWADAVSFSLMCVSGDDKGEQVLYSTNSVGGLNACSKLTGDIMTQIDKDASRPVPVVELLSDSYQHSTFGKTYVPIFALREWLPLTDEMPDLDEDGEAEVAAAKVETKQAEPVKQAEPETARRRRASVPETKQTEQPAPVEAPSAAPAQAEPVRRRRRTS